MNIKLRSFGVAVVIAIGGLFAGGQAFAQIPVTDVAHITLSETNQMANIAKYIEMIAQYKQQIDQMKQQYESLTGTRNLGEIFQNPALKDYLPAEWQDVYDRVASGGYKGLTGTAAAIHDANAIFNGCESYQDDRKAICERNSAKASQDKAFAIEAFDKAKERWDQITALMRQINSTTDAKAIAELQARISAETAAIQNEQTKMQLYALAAQAEDRLIEQQRREANARTWNADGRGVSAEPLTFDH